MGYRARQSTGGVVDPARREIAQHLVASVAVHKYHAVKSLAHKRMSHVVTVVDEHVFTHRDRAGETHIVLVETVVDHRRCQDSASGAPGGLLGDMLHQDIINIDGQVWPVLFDGGDRDY